MKYPKIETLFNRTVVGKKKGPVIEGEYRLPEFEMIDRWYVTEKIDGTNVRVMFCKGERTVPFIILGSRNNTVETYSATGPVSKGKGNFHPGLSDHLKEVFTVDSLTKALPDLNYDFEFSATLFGEGYGPKIQKGGSYRADISFRLFDVYIKDQGNPLGGWWLEPETVADIADALEIKTAPMIAVNYPTVDIVDLVKNNWLISTVAQQDGGDQYCKAEGVVARTKPLLFTRRGKRVMWKLKVRDFPKV